MLRKIRLNTALSQVYFVGDLHGRYTRLQSALKQAGFDAERGDVLFCTGDLVDGGHENEQCLALLGQPWFYSVKGNHDDFLLRYGAVDKERFDVLSDWLVEQEGINALHAWWALDDDERPELTTLHPLLTGSIAHWIVNSGAWFFCPPREQGWAARRDLRQWVSEQPLPLAMEVHVAGKVFGVVHAGVPTPDWSFVVQYLPRFSQQIMWDRSNFVQARSGGAAKDFTVSGIDSLVVGHNIVEKPLYIGNQCFLDVGAKINKGPAVIRADVLLSNLSKQHVYSKEVVDV